MIKWAIIIFSLAIFLVFSLDQQNSVMSQQMKIERAKRVKRALEEKNDQLMLSISSTHNPKALLEKLATQGFSYLKFSGGDEAFLCELEERE